MIGRAMSSFGYDGGIGEAKQERIETGPRPGLRGIRPEPIQLRERHGAALYPLFMLIS